MSKTLEELIGDEDILTFDDLQTKFEKNRTLEDLLGGEDIDALDDDGDSRLMAVLQGFGHENDAFTLIRAGIELDWQSNGDGMAAIHWACMHGRIKVVEEMIERNVKLDARDDNGMTCFMHACLQKNYDCAFAVMDAGGTVNLMKMILNVLEDDYDLWDRSTWTFVKTNILIFMTLPLLISGVERRLQEINQVRESFKNWSPTLVEKEILPFIYCENNLEYLKIVGDPNFKKKSKAEVTIIQKVTYERPKRTNSE